MARTDNLTNYLTDVADAIREKKGTTDVIPANTFDEEIKNLPSGGGDVSEYFETTITNSTYKYFVTNYLVKKIPTITIDSNVTNLNNSFYDARVSELKITGDTSNVTNMSGMFYNCNNLTTIPQLDTSNVTNMSSMFSYCYKLTTIPRLDTSNVTDMSSMFSYCNKLTTIPQLDTSNVNSISNTFQYASALSDFGGLKNIGQAFSTTQSANYSSYKLDLSKATNLTHESLMNVINNLYDIATAGVQAQQLVLGSDNLAKITDEEKAIAQNKGWSLS